MTRRRSQSALKTEREAEIVLKTIRVLRGETCGNCHWCSKALYPRNGSKYEVQPHYHTCLERKEHPKLSKSILDLNDGCARFVRRGEYPEY
jgi:hypothetical protein